MSGTTSTNTPTPTNISNLTNTPTPTNTSNLTNTPTPTNTSILTNTPTPTNTSNLTNTPTPTSTDLQTIIYNMFSSSNIILLIWFLAIYFIIYFLVGLIFNSNGESLNFQSNLSRMLDMIFLAGLLIFFISYYYSTTLQTQEDLLTGILTSTATYVDNPTAILSTGLFIISFYIMVYLFRFPMSSDTKPIFIGLIESISWLLFVIIAFVDFFKYVLGISIIDVLLNFLNLNPTVTTSPANLSPKPSPSPTNQNEVFNISNNLYTYDDAQAICSSYGATIANYEQVEQSYNAGGEWCNYGWSDNQMILFPTQKATWDKLQQNPKHKNNCGRPGVNGGYIDNPYVKFGVNCYGKKPKPSADDLARMTENQNQIVPKTDEDLALEAKINYWKQNADQLLKVNSYNTKKWSKY